MSRTPPSNRASLLATLSAMTILKLFPVSKAPPQRFHHPLPKVLRRRLPLNNRSPPVVKGPSKHIRHRCRITSHTRTLRTNIMVHLTVPDTFLSPLLSIQPSFNPGPLDQDQLVILLGNSPVMLVFNLRHRTMAVCTNKQDTMSTKHITRSTNINIRTVLA